MPAPDAPAHAQGVLDPRDGRAETRRLVEDWLRLQVQLCYRPQEAARLLRAAGWDPARALASVPGPGLPSADSTPARHRAALAALGALLVPLTAPAYPETLRALADGPPLLLVRGDARLLDRPAVAIVGARAATRYGTEIARELAGELARAGLVVVSGLARGVDGAAHRGALEAGGETIAVLASGPETIYPPDHRGLARDIARQGAIVTELPPGAAPRAEHFPLRNRIISGLSRALVVVEARRRSGSLVTARHALDQGREVLAVPGPIHAPTSAGTNALLRDGARPLLEVRDVLDEIGWQPPVRARVTAARPVESDETQQVIDALLAASMTRDELARALGRSPEVLGPLLLRLELEGRVAEGRDGRLAVSPAGALAGAHRAAGREGR